jgi:hypothetical protein
MDSDMIIANFSKDLSAFLQDDASDLQVTFRRDTNEIMASPILFRGDTPFSWCFLTHLVAMGKYDSGLLSYHSKMLKPANWSLPSNNLLLHNW